jgi:hypothetical protein
MTTAIPEKRWITTILAALFRASVVGFVVILIVSIVAAFAGILIWGIVWRPVLALRLSVPIGISSAVLTSYKYIITRINAKSFVKQVYLVISLLLASLFVFSNYEIYRDKLLIEAVCRQFDEAIGQSDYETAYGLMSPTYRKTYTMAQFTRGDGREFINCKTKSERNYIGEVDIGARKGRIVSPPFGSINFPPILEQINNKWYLTGELRAVPG